MRDWIAEQDRRIEQRRRVQVEDEQLQRVAMGMPHFKGCRPIGNRKGEGKQVRDFRKQKTKTKTKNIIQHQDQDSGGSHIT
jgi:hypothetical protein